MSSEKKPTAACGDMEVSESVANLKQAFNRHLHFDVVKDRNVATMRDFYMAFAHVVWDQICSRWIHTKQFCRSNDPKRIYYLSMEFCMGRTLTNTMLNINISEALDEAMYQLGLDIEDLEEIESDAGLGNGGLGRLAACFLDSMATLGLAGHGYGLRYEHGNFHQTIQNGYQVEEPDEWLRFGNPWEKERPEQVQHVCFGGQVLHDGKGNIEWVDTERVIAVPFDTPIPGFRNNVCNTLRLWAAKAGKTLDLKTYFEGDYITAILDRNQAENITRVLYPIDHIFEGKQLRLRQEYFLVSASLRDILRRFRGKNLKRDLFELPYKVAVHLNDTHPSLAIPELMRILIDEEKLLWRDAWDICYQTFTHTNHVARTEALKQWSVDMLQLLLPRHMEIIEKINRDFAQLVSRRWPNDPSRFQRMSIIRGNPEHPVVSMDHLCIVGSHRVNGVSAVQTNHLKTVLFRDFVELWPQKFINITNGITPRRWLLLCNPGLADVIMDAMQGDDAWITNLSMISYIRLNEDDPALRLAIMRVKLDNKNRLAEYLKENRNILIDPSSLFDVQSMAIEQPTHRARKPKIRKSSPPDENDLPDDKQRPKDAPSFHGYQDSVDIPFHSHIRIQAPPPVYLTPDIPFLTVKRVDEYKRHLLMCLHIMTLYNRLKADPNINVCPRTILMGGKAPPGHHMAKLIIKLINSLARTINYDPIASGRLKVVFLNNYCVSTAERVIPAADLSEQIPCVGTEASGTGNMKFMINGALTIGTMDGANVEIFHEVGMENAFVFGRSLEEVKALRTKGYDPRKFVTANPELYHCLEQLRSGYYNSAEPDLFVEIYRMLMDEDKFLVCADYEDYIRAQEMVDITYRNEEKWSRMVLRNIAAAGKFSSDRTVREYASEMWNVEPSENDFPVPAEPAQPKYPKFYIGI